MLSFFEIRGEHGSAAHGQLHSIGSSTEVEALTGRLVSTLLGDDVS
jgi:hypothetical protein